jgi:hypothetical protein
MGPRGGEAKGVIVAQEKLTHQRSVRVVFDRRCKRDACVHGEIPHRTSEAKAVDQIKGDRHVVWIDRNNLVVQLRVVHITVGKINLAGVDIERYHGRVVNHAPSISNTYKGSIVSIPNRPRSERFRGKFGSHGSGHNASQGRKVDRALIGYDISIEIQITGSGGIGGEVEFLRKNSARVPQLHLRSRCQ